MKKIVNNILNIIFKLEFIVATIGLTLCIVIMWALRFSHYNTNILLVAILFCTVMSAVFGFFGILALIKISAFEKSTHEIEYVPITDKDARKFEETDWKKMEKELMKGVKEAEKDNLSFQG